MSNATKTLLALFAVLLVITGIVKLTGNGSSSKGLRSAIIKVDSAKVNKIDIQTLKHGPVTLYKKKKTWYVEGKDTPAYKAQTNLIAGILGHFTDLMPNAVVTRDKSKFRRYQVDTTGTMVDFYNGNKKLGGIILGRFQMEGRRDMNSYVRPENKQVVYSVKGMLSSHFNQPIDNWRNKQVWKLKDKNVKQINLVYPADSSFSITPSGKNLYLYGSDSLKTDVASMIIRDACNLQADSFKHNIKPDNFGKPLYKVQIKMNNGVTNTLKVKPDTSNKQNYIVAASNYPYVFTKDKYTMDNQILRSKNSVLKKKKKKGKK